MEKAKKLYFELCDMDIKDYAETIENDLLFIKNLIDCYGYQDAKNILEQL